MLRASPAPRASWRPPLRRWAPAAGVLPPARPGRRLRDEPDRRAVRQGREGPRDDAAGCGETDLARISSASAHNTARLVNGAGWVELPNALARKYPNAGREWVWQWVFPATRTYVDRDARAPPPSLHESVLQRAVKHAAGAPGSPSGRPPHLPPFVRHAPARGRPRHPDRPGAPGSQ